MKFTKLINAFFILVLISYTRPLSFDLQTSQKFLDFKEQRMSLAQMLEKINANQIKDPSAIVPSLSTTPSVTPVPQVVVVPSTSSTSSSSSSASPMQNSGYLFYGYNIYYGNPHSTEGSIDPGFTNPIFKTSYNLNKLTGDLRFKIPDGSILGKNVGCDVSMSSSAIKDISSYKKSLEAEVSGGANFGVGSFSASANFKAVLEGTSSSESMYIESKADCRVFTGHLNYYEPPKLHNTFVKAIDYIDEFDFDKAKDDYFTFIDYFGTHFINDIEMGARYGYLEKVSVKEYTAANSVSASVSVSGSYGIGSASASFGGSSSNSSSGSNSKKNIKAFSIGVPPPADLNPFTWAEKSLDEPMPIKYKIRPISEIFTNRFFDLSSLRAPEVKIDIPKFAKNLDIAMKAYCSESLKQRGSTSFCNQIELDQVIKKIAASAPPRLKIEDGALLRFKNTFRDRCITRRGSRSRLEFDPCSDTDNNQIFKLMYMKNKKAFKVVTNGALSDGQWDFGKGENRLLLFDFDVDSDDWRIFTFIQEKDDIYKIKSPYNQLCFQPFAFDNNNNEIYPDSCDKIQAQFTITRLD